MGKKVPGFFLFLCTSAGLCSFSLTSCSLPSDLNNFQRTTLFGVFLAMLYNMPPKSTVQKEWTLKCLLPGCWGSLCLRVFAKSGADLAILVGEGV